MTVADAEGLSYYSEASLERMLNMEHAQLLGARQQLRRADKLKVGQIGLPLGPLAETQWMTIPSQQRAWNLLNQTAALRGVMLLSGGNGMGISTLVGRWVRQLV